MRVEAIGLCGSDLHFSARAGSAGSGSRIRSVPGHEMAGRTEDGQLVAIDPAITCGRCELCRAGHPNLCLEIRFSGLGADDGSLREWMPWPRELLFALPDGLTAADGAMLEPLGVALHTVDLAHVRTGASVAVFGSGPIGLLILQAARLAGAAPLFATDLASRPHRLDAARRSARASSPPTADEARAIADASGHGARRRDRGCGRPGCGRRGSRCRSAGRARGARGHPVGRAHELRGADRPPQGPHPRRSCAG